ncbi:MAG TPA: amino acid adenylation domain-containing protein, partial [Candidatus Angelobacter sp.]|nr:amino acid adenylation domain-containing protein [Candidatus Angelobacter sp.]
TPEAVAVVFEQEHLSYWGLNARANRLGHYLRELGVRPDERVAICLERSLEMIVGILGILKAGGGYVPLDPSYPQERLDYMMEDSEIKVVLVQERLQAQFPESSAVVVLDVKWDEESGRESTDCPRSVTVPENLIYVIYTSGSTGKPKGVMNTHKGLSNRLLWMQDAYRLTPQDRVLQKTPFSFDVSVWEFFWPLMVGAELVMAEPRGHQDPHYLGEVIQQNQITTLHFVPPMLNVFLDSAGAQECGSVRQVLCSGEALSRDVARKCLERTTAQLHNLYGPTEASIDVTYWLCEKERLDQGVMIGKPIANMAVYVLNEFLEPVPVGVTGELYLGGIGLARGYLNRPGLTAEQFLPNPFSQPGAERFYRTGDWARYRASGEVEFIGRSDHQVKIRGYRIELGEIESRLEEHAGVQKAVVVARENTPGEKRLVGYVVSKLGIELHVKELRGYLRQRLPEYMVPAVLMTLDQMPVTSNGKIDREALPLPQPQTALSEQGWVRPRNRFEETLCAIWAEVLRRESVGIRDNFFDIGGDSLLAVVLVFRIERAFSVKLPLMRIFEMSTIEKLAEYIDQSLLIPIS